MIKVLSPIPLIFFLLSLSAASFSDDLPTIILSDDNNYYSIGSHIRVYEDPTRRMKFSEVPKMKFKESSEKTPNYGSTRSAVWSVFKLKNTSGATWFLQVETPYLNKVDLYSVNRDKNLEYFKTGLDRKFEERLIKVNNLILPLNLAPGEERIFYLRCESNSTLKLSLNLGTLKKLYETNHLNDLACSIYFGLILALSLYNLFVFISLRDVTYLCYVVYIFFLGCTVAWLKGYTSDFFGHLFPTADLGNYFACTALASLVLFSNKFLYTRKYRRYFRWIGIFFYSLGAAGILLTLFGYHFEGFHVVVVMVFLMIPCVVVMGTLTYLNGFKPAVFYLIGFMCFTIGDVVFVLKEYAILSHNLFTEFSMLTGSALEAIILSFALANKLNTYKKEKEEMQEKALQQANEFSKLLIKSQEDERKRIAGELHDSVGQSLSLIKNKVTLLSKDLEVNDFGDLNCIITQTIQEVRGISYGLRPFQLDLLGLTEALKSLVEDMAASTEIKFYVEIDSIDNYFTKEAEINIYRIIQECLNNIVKHSRASEAIVRIQLNSGAVSILIKDNGIGLGECKYGKGLGLIGIRERVNILDGSLTISPGHAQGTSIEITLKTAPQAAFENKKHH